MKTRIVVNGVPGKMATAIAIAISNDPEFELMYCGLTGPEIKEHIVDIAGHDFALYQFCERGKMLFDFGRPGIFIDFTAPAAIEDNVAFYVQNKIPFVSGTTGGDFEKISAIVNQAGVSAVIASNMAKEIVVFQTMLKDIAKKFPGAFSGCSLEVFESHQSGKKDTSGTAKDVVASFSKLGIDYSPKQIKKNRSEEGYRALGIPEEFWGGHGWHTYSVKKADGSIFLQFTHNINGRAAYVSGVIDAVHFLKSWINCFPGDTRIFNMGDVLELGGKFR
jgi:4-hydroxy-tetrahydrodipicolinate reductase